MIDYPDGFSNEWRDYMTYDKATDPDAGVGIETALRADIFSSGSYGHGVLYQRIAHYLSKFIPLSSNGLVLIEFYEKRIHFTLQLISLFSIYLFLELYIVGWIFVCM